MWSHVFIAAFAAYTSGAMLKQPTYANSLEKKKETVALANSGILFGPKESDTALHGNMKK